MKKTIRIALIAVSATVISVAFWQTSKAQGDKAGLEKTANAFLEAVNARDIAKLKTYYTDDYTLTDADGKIMNADERLKVLANPGANAPVSFSFSDIKARTYGTTGVVTGMATTKTSSGATEQSRFTQVWTWQGGRWRLAAGQITRITP